MPRAKPVLVIGSLNMDLVARCEHLPRTGQTVFGTDFFTAAGGKGANQAVAAARLGARVAMAGCVGDDQFGRDLVAGLRRDGVRSDAVQAVALPTGTALITIDADGANTIVVISGANAACDTALVDRALAGATAGDPAAAARDPGSSDRARDPRGACGGMVHRAQSGAGASDGARPAAADRHHRAERDRGCGAHRAPAIRREAARHLLAQGARAALITLGGDGALYCDAAGTLHCPAVAVQAVDTTAAGDAYIGALAAALAEGRSVADSLASPPPPPDWR